MSIIYEPSGKAREYSPLAANLYSGCGHKCKYCYVPGVLRSNRKDFDEIILERKLVIKELEKDCKKFKHSDKQVLMSFTTDPYNQLNDEAGLTRKSLLLFLEYQIPIAILTKSGMRATQDIDVVKKFGRHIKIGASLTYDNDIDSQRVESGAALPSERLLMLKTLHDSGIRTWASFEPIIDLQQTYNVMVKAIPFTDEFQLGKLANDNRALDWNEFLRKTISLLRNNKKDFYVKESLRKAANKINLTKEESDMDYLTLRPFELIKESLF
jgi:DNA repair photolyase